MSMTENKSPITRDSAIPFDPPANWKKWGLVPDGAVIQFATHYHDNKVCAFTANSLGDNEALGTATINITAVPAKGNIIIKSWSENEGLYEALHSSGLISEPVIRHKTGHVEALEVTCLGDLATLLALVELPTEA